MKRFNPARYGFRSLSNGAALQERPFRDFLPSGEDAEGVYAFSGGPTPLIDLAEFGLPIPNGNRILAKMELSCTPNRATDPLGGSHYYRVYPYLLEILRQQRINPQEHALLEVSSGSAGEAFAYFAKRFGFEAHCVFPHEISETRRNLAAQHGATIHLPDPKIDGRGLPGASHKFQRTLQEKHINGKRLWSPNHSQVIETLAPLATIPDEIESELRSRYQTGLDAFFAGVGNCCSLYAIGAILKYRRMLNRIIAFDPLESPAMFALKYPSRYEAEVGPLPDFGPEGQARPRIPIPGLGGYGIDFPYLHASVDIVDEVKLLKNSEWQETHALLLEKTGLNVGRSSAASLMFALRMTGEVYNKTLLVVFYDAGEGRY